jgi:hypothetical protein
VAAQLLERRRDHIIQIPSPRDLSVTIRDAEDLWYCIDKLFTDCPHELQVNLEAVGLDENLMAGSEPSALEEVQLATSLPAYPIIGQIPEKSYQAQRANLYVTKVSERQT